MWVRGLKRVGFGYDVHALVSHPVWVRGLKLGESHDTPYRGDEVAPRVGAWIETLLLRW